MFPFRKKRVAAAQARCGSDQNAGSRERVDQFCQYARISKVLQYKALITPTVIRVAPVGS